MKRQNFGENLLWRVFDFSSDKFISFQFFCIGLTLLLFGRYSTIDNLPDREPELFLGSITSSY